MIDQITRNHMRVVVGLLLLIGAMTAFVSYSVTLYRLFCEVTGLGGVTQRVQADTASVSESVIAVRFNTDVAPNLPWRFEPMQNEVKVHLGEEKLVFFSAENLADEPIVGHATFNVTPARAGPFFKKIQCFCFEEERLEAHQKVEMPVDFFVDPGLANDADARDVRTVTLSYTFFRSREPQKGKELSRLAGIAVPDPQRGKELFIERCTACHYVEHNNVGPMLSGVFGRKAGSVAGYNYSVAVRDAGINWSGDNLDRWLADPRNFIAGAKMPVRIIDPNSRRDIIAYLQELSPQTASTGDGKPVGRP